MMVDLSEREITVLRVAGLQKLSRLLADIPDGCPDSVYIADIYNELRDLVIKLGETRNHARG